MKKILISTLLVMTVVIILEVLVLVFYNKTQQSKTVMISERDTYSYWVRRKPVLVKSTKIDVMEGEIDEIDTASGDYLMNGISGTYALKIVIKDSKGDKYTFLYDQVELERTTIGNESGKTGMKKLVKGDVITITETVNLLGQTHTMISANILKK